VFHPTGSLSGNVARSVRPRVSPNPALTRWDIEELNSVRWFVFAEAPISRSHPHLGRFLKKLAL
jgi:hypothetical protein